MASKKVKSKTAAKKMPAKKMVKVAPKMSAAKKVTAVKETFSKSQIVQHLADATCLAKKQVNEVILALTDLIELHLKKRGPGQFILPGLAKFKVISKPATKARQGINPFTGAPTTFAAKPARNIVKIRPLKKLKDMAK
jgi:nucleoid DNA-binding protein